MLRAVVAGGLASFLTLSAGDQTAGVRFREVAETSGLRFRHAGTSAPSTYYVDSVPGGLAVFDFNGDGRPDVFFTNSAALPSLQKAGPAYANRLYRNDGGMHFTDVTEAAGVSGVG